jgi:non-ribosomal peptide synthase protein (TIGR01720 family)
LQKADNPGDALKVVKEQLRSISGQGIDYGVLRYLNKDAIVRDKMRVLPPAEVAFLYVGQLAKSLPQDSLFQLSESSPEATSSLQATRPHKLHLIVSVVEGQLQLDWCYSKNVHRLETIEKLSANFVKSLKSIVTYSQFLETVEYTPSDFVAANINQENLSKLLAQIGQSDRRNS